MARSRFKMAKRKSKGSKGGSSKRTTSSRKFSTLKKTNRRATRQKMARNREKYSASKGNLKQAKQKHAEYMRSEKKRFDTEAQQIKDRPDLSDEKRRRKLTRLQLARRQREAVATSRLSAQEQTHAATREKYRSAQQRQLEKYRQRKRAIDYAERAPRTSYTQRTTVAVTPGYAAPVYGAVPAQYGTMPPQYGAPPPPQYGGMPPQYGAPPPPQYGGTPPQYGEAPPSQLDSESPPYNEAAPSGFADAASEQQDETGMYATSSMRREEKVRRVITGIDEPEQRPEMRDIPALRELDQGALEAFLLARDKFEQATTPTERVRYSVEFFELTAKLDAMFHLHTKVWHRDMKFRPPGRTVSDAIAFTDNLSKEEVESLAKMDDGELKDYLATAF